MGGAPGPPREPRAVDTRDLQTELGLKPKELKLLRCAARALRRSDQPDPRDATRASCCATTTRIPSLPTPQAGSRTSSSRLSPPPWSHLSARSRAGGSAGAGSFLRPRRPARQRRAARRGRTWLGGSSNVRVARKPARKRRSCVTRSDGSVEGVERALELLDRGDVEMVRRLVEHEAVHAARREQRQQCARALARRQRRRIAQDVIRSETELRQQRA